MGNKFAVPGDVEMEILWLPLCAPNVTEKQIEIIVIKDAF